VRTDRKRKDYLAKAIWIGLGFVFAIAAVDAILAPTPVSKQPGFIDTVLASRAVIASLRIAIVFAATFLVLSVVALIASRQWLTRVGPVEVSAKVSGLAVENRILRERLEEARVEIARLETNVANAQQVIHRGGEDD
jgi:hypothetical protein